MKKLNKKNINWISHFMSLMMFFSFWETGLVYAEDGSLGENLVFDILTKVTEILLVVAGLFCVGKLIQIGIKFMMTSVDQKSNAKEAILPWLVGTIVCFSAAGIGKMIISILNTGHTDVLSY